MRQYVAASAPVVSAPDHRRVPPGFPRMLAGTRWWLHPDGRLLVAPLPGLARDDLFPLPGVYRPDGNGIRFQAALANGDSSARVTMAGTIGADARLQLRYTIQTSQHDVVVNAEQALRSVAPGSPVGFPPVDGVPVPAVYAVTLTGSAAGVAFGPLPAELTVLPPVAASPDPVEILLAGDDITLVGDLTWVASAPGLTEDDTGRYTLETRDSVVQCALDAGPNGAMAVTWTAAPQVPAGLTLSWTPPGMPLPSRSARLQLRFAGRHVRGRVDATAHRDGHLVEYTAQVEGARADTEPADPLEAFEHAWRVPTRIAR